MSKKPQNKPGAPAPANDQERAERAQNSKPAPEGGSPVISAIALAFVKGKGWTSIVYEIRGDKVLSIKASEPDLKLLAQEKFKVNAGQIVISETGRLPPERK